MQHMTSKRPLNFDNAKIELHEYVVNIQFFQKMFDEICDHLFRPPKVNILCGHVRLEDALVAQIGAEFTLIREKISLIEPHQLNDTN